MQHTLTPDVAPSLEPNLARVLADACALLRAGATDPGSAWRTMALGSIGLDGAPQVRTVVLRGFDPGEPWLEVHTDARSAKYAELRANPAAMLHGWDPAGLVQLRAMGTAHLHRDDATAQQAWSQLRQASRQTYQVDPGPGTRLATPDAHLPALEEANASAVFCVIRLHVRALNWLHLQQGSHRRAGFAWDRGGITATWLAP